jgi:tRNA (cmo5U34)-methyltransferase
MDDPGLGGPRGEFDREASRYDATAPRTMPGYDELHQMLIWGIPFLPTRGLRVLELGVGTGTLAARLLAEFPHAQFTGVDLSPRMIEISRRKLRPFRDRVTLATAQLADFRPDGRYDVVVSSLAIHHLTNPEKWKLFRRVRQGLAPGGYFGDADDHLPEDPIFDSRFTAIAESLSPRAGRNADWSSPQRAWHAHEQFDHPCPLSMELTALGRAGFPHVGVPWRFFGQAVVWAYR